MESAEMNQPDASDPLETMLHEATPRIADDGFSARVMVAVDTGRRRARIRLASMIVGGATGLVVAAGAGAFGPGAAHVSTNLQRSFAEVAALAANPAVVVAALIIIAALIYVFRSNASDASAR
jgi:hypothetical protein